MNRFGLNREPVAWLAFVRVLLALVVAFGLRLTAEQVALIVAAAETGSALFLRPRVTPRRRRSKRRMEDE